MSPHPAPDPDSTGPHVEHPVLNRFLILVRPGPAYFDWALSFGDMDTSSLEEGFTAYLVPPLHSNAPGDALDFLEPFWRTIADEEFASCRIPCQSVRSLLGIRA